MTLTRCAYAVALGLALMTMSCRTMGHSDAKLEAQQRWNHMRARVKQGLATQQFEGGLFDETVHTLIESMALDANQADAYALLARANLELGKLASAQRALATAEGLGISSAELIYLQGVILEQRGQLEAAAARYAEARRLSPDSVDFLIAEAESLVTLGSPAAALGLLDEHADRLDDDGTIPALAAHISALLGDTDGAVRRYRQALVAHQGVTVSARAHAGARIPSRTASQWSEIGTLSPDAVLIAAELGRLLVRGGRYEEALSVLRPLVDAEADIEPGGAVRRALASCHLALGDPTSARRVLSEYAPAHPADAHAQLLLAKAAIAIGDIITALRAVDLVRQREPDRPELWLLRATVNWKRGRLGAAASDLYDFLQNNPDDVDAHCLLAEVLRAQQRVEAARTHFERALQINPDFRWAIAGLKALNRVRRAAPDPPSAKLTAAAAGPLPVPAQP